MNYSPLPVLAARGVKLTPTGRDCFRCACPVHRGERSSMGVSLRDGRWQITCWQCNFSGGTPDLVMALQKCTLAEAFRILEGVSEPVGAAPVDLHPRDYVALVCDRCGDAMKVTAQPYKVAGIRGPLWESTILQEVFCATSHGWEISAHAEFALCPDCLAGPKSRIPFSPAPAEIPIPYTLRWSGPIQ